MDIKNGHIRTAYEIVSTLSVSGDAVDAVWAIRQQLLMADREFAAATSAAEKAEKLEEVDECST